jgi:magnesium transporter
MSSVFTFYLSRILGNKVYSSTNGSMGKLQDLIVDMGFIRPKVIAVKIKLDGSSKILDFSGFTVSKEKGQYKIICNTVSEIEVLPENTLFLLKHILDKQIVDIDGRKLVRVNDLRLASLEAGVLVVAVDVGIEGLLRRLGIAKQVKKILKPFSKSVPSKLILWDEVETIDFTNKGIKLSKAFSKLSTLHPSDLADIIEDMDSKTQAEIFASLDEEKAADVLEELETDAKIKVLESLSVEKAADVLEKMPADEVADLLDEIDEDKAEELLDEMENEASEEVRELMEYPDNSVGSLMATDYISFSDKMTVNDTILELRRLKPESDTIYYLYVVDSRERLIGTVSLRDIIVSCPDTTLSSIMNKNVIHVCDNDKIDSLAEIISKYSLLAIPVVDEEMKMMGVVVIDDVVYDLMKRKKRKI